MDDDLSTPPRTQDVTRSSKVVQKPPPSLLERGQDAARPGRGPGRSLAGLLVGAVANGLGDLLVRVPEGHARAYERLGRVGREEERVAGRLREPAAVDLEPAHEHRQRLERQPQLATTGEDGCLVLLQVAVVRE